MPKFRHYLKRPRAAIQTAYGPIDIAKAYGFPTGLPGGGAIAIIELGGGWVQSDIDAFFAKYDLPNPNIVDIECDAKNAPGGDADGEVALDIQYAAGPYSYCTGKPADVRMYWATDFIPAVERIITDIKAGVKIAAVSVSWGAPEDALGMAYCKQADGVFAKLAAMGIPLFPAAGDNDSGDGESGKHVDFPASSPNVIGCGGTTKTEDAETVWNNGPNEGTGGGFSTFFPRPSWQGESLMPFRMVPDVAANADPHTGYEVYCQGYWQVVGGTSAVAPLYAGFVAAVGSGKLAADLWANRGAFADITQGDNGAYNAVAGPDPCTGLGVPIGAALAAVLTGSSAPSPDPAPTPDPQPVPNPTPEPPNHPGNPGHGHRHHHPGRGRHGEHGRHGHGRHGRHHLDGGACDVADVTRKLLRDAELRLLMAHNEVESLQTILAMLDSSEMPYEITVGSE